MPRIVPEDLFLTIDIADPPGGWPATDAGRRASTYAGTIRETVRETGAAVAVIDGDGALSAEGRRMRRDLARNSEVRRLSLIWDELGTAADRSLGERLMLLRDAGPTVDDSTRAFVWKQLAGMAELDRAGFLLKADLSPVVAAAVQGAPAVPPFDSLDEGTKDHLVRTAIGPAGARRLEAWKADHDALRLVQGFAIRARNRATAALGAVGETQPQPASVSVEQLVAQAGAAGSA